MNSDTGHLIKLDSDKARKLFGESETLEQAMADKLKAFENEDKKAGYEPVPAELETAARFTDRVSQGVISSREYQLIAIRNQGLRAENDRLRQWVNDLQSGMYVNCVYCGHRYGPADEVPASMADILKQHIEQCPEHPMTKMKQENEQLRNRLAKYTENAAKEEI